MILSAEEEKEFDLLAFRIVADLPFGPDEQTRYIELKQKRDNHEHESFPI
jgi:hypothetical protein